MNSKIIWINRIINNGYRSRLYCQKAPVKKKKVIEDNELSLIRNIGVLAHIDAGKTTTTERMLFYSGTIDQMGEVHHGNTVTDFMEQERERGITITSASVTFQWKNHIINLLDTPGHIDFTMEVEQTLNVMDGAVIILDGSAGVEAQTITVWRQADRHKIPRIIYINKMDKTSSDFFTSVNSVEKKLNSTPIILQLPVVNESHSLKGVIDVLTLEKYEWNSDLITAKQTLKSTEDGELWEKAVGARVALVETLADFDDELAETVLQEENSIENVSSDILKKSIRKITSNRKGIPVLCGSSYKNIGVQLLMDAVVDYLPSPLSGRSGKMLQSFGTDFCARVFKVRHDDFKGPVTFVRIYSGSLTKNQKLFFEKKKKHESCGKLYVAYADDYEEVSRVGAGSIAAVTGLKSSTLGDLVTSSATAYSSALKSLSKAEDAEEILSSGAQVLDPVFFCSVEAPSAVQQPALDKALSALEREDPSLKVSVNSETGQTVLGGMGELHLEIIKERIKREYKVEVESGPLQIAYKEVLVEDAKDSFSFKQTIGSSQYSIKLILSVLRSDSQQKEKLLLDKSPESAQNVSSISLKNLSAVKDGVEKALESGPKFFCPVMHTSVMLHWLEIDKNAPLAILVSATIQSVKKLLIKAKTKLFEPVMIVEIVCSNDKTEVILNDLSRRRAEVLDAASRCGTDLVIRALVPLSELLGYATTLRILSSGTAAFSMELHTFKAMDPEEEAKAVKYITGFSC